MITYHPALFYLIQTLKQLCLKIIPQFYNEWIDLILSFFSFCKTNKTVSPLEPETPYSENLGLEHLYNLCYCCGGCTEMHDFELQKIPLLIRSILFYFLE